MTKNEAIQTIRLTSSGTIASIIGNAKYSAIDAAYCDWILAAADAAENAFENCASIWDVVDTIHQLAKI